MERAMGWGRSVGEFMGGAGLGVGDEGLPPDAIPKAEPDRVYPAPPPAAIRDLKANPHQVDEFNKKYGNGAAEKAVPGIRRLLLLNQ